MEKNFKFVVQPYRIFLVVPEEGDPPKLRIRRSVPLMKGNLAKPHCKLDELSYCLQRHLMHHQFGYPRVHRGWPSPLPWGPWLTGGWGPGGPPRVGQSQAIARAPPSKAYCHRTTRLLGNNLESMDCHASIAPGTAQHFEIWPARRATLGITYNEIPKISSTFKKCLQLLLNGV